MSRYINILKTNIHNFIRHFNWIFLVILICFSSCTDIYKPELKNKNRSGDPIFDLLNYEPETGINEFGVVYGDIDFTIDKEKKREKFGCYFAESLNVYITLPIEWSLKKREQFLIYAEIDVTPNNYFLILKQNLAEKGISLEDYNAIVIDKLKSDTTEFFNEGEFENYYLNNSKSIIYMQGVISIIEDEFQFFTYIFERNGIFYDFTYKAEKDNNIKLNKYIFDLICFSFVENGKKILPQNIYTN